MIDLDQKLEELLGEGGTIKHCCGQSGCSDAASDIEQIKQAFIDAGYVQIPQVEMERDPTNNRPTFYTVNGKEVMTGQEWYDRFVKIANGDEKHSDLTGWSEWDTIEIVAKKAAGIK